MKKQKICIVGGGLTGLTAALVLKNLNIEIHLVSEFKLNKKLLDNRTTAISPSNYHFLFKFLNKKNSKIFWGSNKIDLYHEELNKYYHFMNFQNKGKNLMYTIQNKNLRKIIFNEIKSQKKIKIINKKVEKIDEKNAKIFFKNKIISYDSILLCAGKKAQLVEKLMGKRRIINDSQEIALTAIVKHSLNIVNSKQYFLKEGPLAILPINKKEFSLVWSIYKGCSLYIKKNLIKEKLKKILNSNKKMEISKVDFFPISFNFNVNFFKKNVLVLGEGSYNVHPLAGQGFNLILRDIEELYQEIKKYLSIGIQIKDSEIFYKFMISRKPENFLFGLGINLINNFFRNEKINNPVKKIILKDIDKFKFLKDLNIRISDTGLFK